MKITDVEVNHIVGSDNKALTTKKHIDITLGISFKTYKEVWLRQIEDRK